MPDLAPTALAREAVVSSAAAEVTIADGSKPATYPVTPFFDHDRDLVIISSPPAFANKFNPLETTPALSLRFYHGDRPGLLRGTARVRDDDPWEGSQFLRALVRDGPDTPKQQAYESLSAKLDAGLGRLLLDWYALRVVVEIEPSSFSLDEPPVTPASLPAWPAVGMNGSEASRYDRVVLGMLDEEGYPTSWTVSRCTIEDETAILEAPGRPAVEAGQLACLLCHWHTRELEDLGQRLIRGRIRTDGDRVRFSPGSSFTLHNETALDAIRFIIDGKRRTRRALGSGPLTWTW